MNSENSILGNQLVVMSRADLDALVEKMASNLIAMRFPYTLSMHVEALPLHAEAALLQIEA